MVHIICCFQCPSAVVKKWQKSPVVHRVELFCFAWFVFQTPGGNFTQVYIIFLLPEEKILLKCPCSRFRLM